MLLQIIQLGKTLYLLLLQITIRHGVPDGYYLEAFFHQGFNYLTGSLALTTACTNRTHRNNGLGALDHRVFGTQQHEVGTGTVNNRADAHHMLVGYIAV